MSKPFKISTKSASWTVNSIGAIFLILIMLIGLAGFVWKWFYTPSQKISVESINNNVAKSIVPTVGNQLGRGIKWVVFGELGSEVEQGCSGWLFLTDERRTYDSAKENESKRLEIILLLAEFLKQKDIRLLIAFVPDKSRVQQEQLCHLARPIALEQRVEGWVSSLRHKEVPAIDLAQSMDAGSSNSVFYYATDTHWNEKGAELAAIAIAEQVKQLHVDIVPRVDYEQGKGILEKYQGDLLKLAGIDTLPFWFTRTLQEDREKKVFIEKPQQDDSSSLFGDDLLPNVFLLGTSFSKNSYFVDFLQEQLSTVIPNFSVEGGGFWRAASQYFESAAFLKTPPKVIVWEVPERMMQAPIEKDELNWFQAVNELVIKKNQR